MAPVCGRQNTVVTVRQDRIMELFGIIGLIALIMEVIEQVGAAGEVVREFWLFTKVMHFWGLSLPLIFVVWAVLVYLVVVFIIFMLWYEDCVAGQSGDSRCLSGVVEAISGEETGFYVDATHPHLDLVVKSTYWPVVELNPDYVYCSDAGSAVLKVFFKSSRICAVKGGAAAGAAVAGIGGIIGGAAAAAAIGCATIVLCALALIVAAVIVIAAVIVGALVGGAVADAVTEPAPPSDETGTVIAIGDFLAAQGPTVKNKNYRGAIVQYFNEEATLMGRSTASPSYTYEEPDARIPDDADVCLTS